MTALSLLPPSPMLARVKGAPRRAVPLTGAARWEIWRLGLPRRLRRIDALDARASAEDRASRRRPRGRAVVLSPHTPRPR